RRPPAAAPPAPQPPPPPLPPPPPPPPPTPPRRNFNPSGWGDDEDDELGRWEEGLDYEQEPRGSSEPSAQVPPDEQPIEPTRLRRAPAAGLAGNPRGGGRRGRCPWLRGRRSGWGVVWERYLGGPLGGAGVALAGSALGLLSLGQGTLAAFGSP